MSLWPPLPALPAPPDTACVCEAEELVNVCGGDMASESAWDPAVTAPRKGVGGRRQAACCNGIEAVTSHTAGPLPGEPLTGVQGWSHSGGGTREGAPLWPALHWDRALGWPPRSLSYTCVPDSAAARGAPSGVPHALRPPFFGECRQTDRGT